MLKAVWSKVKNHYNYVVCAILVCAFLIRLAFDIWVPGGLSLDAQSYYKAALNIVNGVGYSDYTEAPFLPFYFREPLTSYSIALSAWIYKIAFGIEHLDYPSSWAIAEMQPWHQMIILIVKTISSLLQLAGLFLFSLLIRKYTSKKAALLFLGISAVYVPLVIYHSLLLREVYVFFLLLLMTFLWERFITTDRWAYLVSTALVGGIICLYLHLYWILLLFFIPFLIVHERKRLKTTGMKCLVFILLFFLPSVPWVHKVYQYYPDIRVAKTLGSALTVDYTNALNAYRAHGVDPYYVKQGDIPGNVKVWTDIFSIRDARKNFQYTFDGTYKREAERLNAANTRETLIKYYLYRVGLAFRNTVFIVGITYDYEIFWGNFSAKEILKFLFCIPYIVMGLLALYGMWYVVKKYWILMPAFFYNAVFFFAYGDEERRQYVLVPWIIIMAMTAVWMMWKNSKKRENDKISDCIPLL